MKESFQSSLELLELAPHVQARFRLCKPDRNTAHSEMYALASLCDVRLASRRYDGLQRALTRPDPKLVQPVCSILKVG